MFKELAANIIRSERYKQLLTQEGLARKAGLHRSSISSAETGSLGSIVALEAILDALDITVVFQAKSAVREPKRGPVNNFPRQTTKPPQTGVQSLTEVSQEPEQEKGNAAQSDIDRCKRSV